MDRTLSGYICQDSILFARRNELFGTGMARISKRIGTISKVVFKRKGWVFSGLARAGSHLSGCNWKW